jgi:hypothetical protein
MRVWEGGSDEGGMDYGIGNWEEDNDEGGMDYGIGRSQ